jgi:thiamine biosynthesis lipoprotein
MISRARPLLGTFVCIRTDGDEPAIRAAFRAIETVQRLMNVHSGESDLARINRGAHRRAICVHPWTYQVLAIARRISDASGGAFDVTLGRHGARHTDVDLQDANRVRLRRTARLDLSGIAKGFAVDKAVEALRRHHARQGSVNAGGDLRVFGDEVQDLRVRVPHAPHLTLPLPSTREGAFATSGNYFGSTLRDPRTGSETGVEESITVGAPSCVVADALTKVVAAAGPKRGLLRHFNAVAFLVDRNGTLYAARS